MIHTLALPTPFQVGRVNTYLIEDSPLTLIDTGPNSGKALDALEVGLAALGHRVEDLELIVLTHQHIDHIGLAAILARRSGAEVAALDALAPWLGEYRERMEADDRFAEELMLRHGVPAEVSLALRAVSSAFRGWGSSVEVTRPLRPNEPLRLRDRTLQVLHRPGHSPSDTVFHDAERRELIGGDHLIAHISSNPLIARPLDGSSERPRALHTYMESLRATRAMEDVDVVYAGHGEPVRDHATLIDARFAGHERRASKIHGLLSGDAPLSAHDIAHSLWGNVALTQAYLTLSEVLGHLDLLMERGQVVEEDDGAVLRYRAA